MSGKGQVEILNIGDGVVGKATFEPGWRWSEHVKPLAGTDSCQAAHLGYVLSGRQKIVMDDGTELEFGPGDVIAIPPGHDGEVIGDEPCIVLDFADKGGFARHLWSFVDGRPIDQARRSMKKVPVDSDASRAIAKDLRARGGNFVGPTIVYAFMQAVGMVNDHLVTCYRHPTHPASPKP